MGQLHNELRRGPLSNALSLALGDTRGGGLERFGETLQPTVDLWALPEWAFLRQERHCAGFYNATSAAGTRSEGLLFNPVGSRRIVVVVQAKVRQSTAVNGVNARLLRAAALPAGFVAVNSGPIDTRDPQLIAASGSVAIVAQAANAAADGGITFDEVFHPTAGIYTEIAPGVVLAPGTGLVLEVGGNGVNTLVGSFRWRERAAFPGELV